jgi:ribose 5-phosphate isomerase B
MKIGFGSDHAAIELKNALLEHMQQRGYECVDFGAYSPEEKVDYPVPGRMVAEAIRRGEIDRGVLVCGTGVGISLAANKVPGIRAGVCSEPYTAKMIAEHNNCQIVAMGARVVGVELAKMICDAFFAAQFEGGRHARRVGLIRQVEEDYGYADAPIL